MFSLSVVIKLRRTLLSALVCLLALASAAVAEPLPIEFHWCYNQNDPTMNLTIPPELSEELKIYDSEDVAREPRAPQRDYLKRGNTTRIFRVAKYELEPGVYRWECPVMRSSSYGAYPIKASGRFVVEYPTSERTGPQQFVLAPVSIAGRVGGNVNGVSVNQGAPGELRDYLGYTVLPFLPNQQTAGFIYNYYYLIMRGEGEAYKYTVKPGVDGFLDTDFNVNWDDEYLSVPINTDELDASASTPTENMPVLLQHYLSTLKEGQRYREFTCTLTVPNTFTIDVPAGATPRLFYKGAKHFAAFTEYARESAAPSAEGRVKYSFKIPPGVDLHYDVAGDGYTRAWQEIYARTDWPVTAVTVDLAPLENSHIDQSGGLGSSVVYANVGGSQFVELAPGEHRDLFPFRVDQVQEGVAGNYFNEPDFNFELIDDGGSVAKFHSLRDAGLSKDNGVVKIAASPELNRRGREEYRLTALAAGLSVLRVSYDAMHARASMGQGNREPNIYSGSEVDGHNCVYFNPTNPPDILTVVIAVGGDSFGVDTGIALDAERDAVYFDSRGDHASFTFEPRSDEDAVRVRVHDPLHLPGVGRTTARSPAERRTR